MLRGGFDRPDLLRAANSSAFDDKVVRRVRGDDREFCMPLPQAFAEIDELIAGSSKPQQVLCGRCGTR
jgi:hypothetical protein